MSGAPDVYLFVVDSLREDVVSYDPDEPALTPNFAEFAARSAVFDTATTNGVGTAPAMTSLLTGSLPLSHGGHWWLEDDRTTVAEALDHAGYRTAAIHTNPNVSRLRNFDKGFDTFDENLLPVVPGSLIERLPDWSIRMLNKGMRVVRQTPYLSAGHLRKKVLSWVDQTSGPRFVWTQFMDVHGPYLSHEGISYLDKFRAERLWRKAAVTDPDAVTDGEHEELWRRYRAEVAHWDEAFGELVDGLEQRGALSDALVIVTSDHGEEFSEHGTYGHGNNGYEEVVRVPLLVNFPDGGFAGERVSDPVRLLDVVPTVLDVLDSDTSLFGDQLVGESLVGLLDGSRAPDTYQPAIVEKEVRGTDDLRFAVRTSNWKYIQDGHEGVEELYDLESDPEETRNLVAEEPEALDRFRSVVERRSTELSEREGRSTVAESDEVQSRLEKLGYVE